MGGCSGEVTRAEPDEEDGVGKRFGAPSSSFFDAPPSTHTPPTAHHTHHTVVTDATPNVDDAFYLLPSKQQTWWSTSPCRPYARSEASPLSRTSRAGARASPSSSCHPSSSAPSPACCSVSTITS